MGDPRRDRRRRRLTVIVALLAVTLLTAAIWTDVQANTRTRNEKAALAAANAHLASLRHQVAATLHTTSFTNQERTELESYISVTLGQLAGTNSSLDTAKVTAFLQGANIATLQTCLGGVQNALAQIKANNNTQAARDISAVSGPCTQLAGGTTAGLVYPFDFPDPDVILVGQTYYAYGTNSVAGNIQIIRSTDLTNWTAVGNALPGLPSWAARGYTWAPSVAVIGGKYDLYYAVDPANSSTECISVATAGSPQGPFIDTSTAPLECQASLGGSIDPSAFIDTNGTAYLQWKSGGPGTSKIWSQELAPSGTAFITPSTPTLILTPDQSWQAGTVEAPDLVTANGTYDLFYSGNDWDSGNYAVGVATCTGPLGPCSDNSSNPILSTDANVAGPGGQSVFADDNGSFWIAFHAWVPGAVGFPNSRDLYIRRLNLSGSVPVVGAAP